MYGCNTLQQVATHAYGYLGFELILAFLKFGDKGVRVLARPFLRPNPLRYVQNLQWIQKFIFLNGKYIYPNLFINS